jgi:hypothetical protein
MTAPTRPPKEIRRAARMPLVAAAVGAGTAETTARVYEANREGVNVDSREKLDRFYAALEAKLASSAADPSTPEARSA